MSNVKHPMYISRKTCLFLALLGLTVTVFAQENAFSSPSDAISNLFPNMNVSEWTSVNGDWNGDGIKDVAVILTYSPENSPLETRLLVLAGAPGGKYLPLSISSRYCDAQKFFNLEAKGDSLFVTEVHKVEGDASTTNTLQFRFNKKIADFELIGKENIWASRNEYGRSSVNYLAGKYIDYDRVRGRVKVKEQKRFEASRLARLNGFNCDKYFDGMPY